MHHPDCTNAFRHWWQKTLMAKITIDTDIWVTPKQLAKELGYATQKDDCTQRISNWIRRGKIKSKHIAELGITLVDRTTIPSHS